MTVVEECRQDVTIDEILDHVGEFQRFQWILAVACCMMTFAVNYQVLIMSFAADNPRWKCVDNSRLCTYNGTLGPYDYKRCSLPRSEWEYTKPKEYSVVTYYDIYCDTSWMIESMTSLFFIGWAVGGLIFGWMSDNYGRKATIFISYIFILFSGFTVLVTNVYWILVLRFFSGFFYAGTLLQMAVLLSEMVCVKYRPLAANVVYFITPISWCVLCLKAYFIRNWKTLYLVCTVPYTFALLFYPIFPESPRWLRLRGKYDALMTLLQRIARINKRTFPENVKIARDDGRQLNCVQSSIFSLFRTRAMAGKTFITSYCMFATGFIYFMYFFAASNLGASLYLTTFLLCIVDVPGNVIAVIATTKLGRKLPPMVVMSSAGLACMVLIFIPDNVSYARIILGMLGKFYLAINLGTVNIWFMELFPTSIRSQSVAVINVAFNIGSSLAPLIVFRLGWDRPYIPYLFQSVTAFLCFGLFFLLPDTKEQPTLETENDYHVDTSSQGEREPLIEK